MYDLTPYRVCRVCSARWAVYPQANIVAFAGMPNDPSLCGECNAAARLQCGAVTDKERAEQRERRIAYFGNDGKTPPES